MKYTTKTAIENYLLKNIDSSFDDQIDSWIEAMSRYMDNQTNRILVDDVKKTFLYDGMGGNSLLIKDCCDIEDVQINHKSVDFFAYPANSNPKTKIKINGNFPFGFQNIKITGFHAYSKELTAQIEFICTILVAGIINESILKIKGGTSEKIGNYTVTYDDSEKSQSADFARIKTQLGVLTRLAI